MKFILTALMTVSFGQVLPAGSPGIPGSVEHRKAQEYVRQLASPKYKERERAAGELIRMGRAAKAALVAGKSSSDVEVQNRCHQLLPQALSLDLAARVARYLKDTESRLEHDLPLMKRYQEMVGTDENARTLYTEMLKSNAALLEAVEEQPDQVTALVQHRIQEMYQEMFGNGLGGGVRRGYRAAAINPAELCCVMFVAATPAFKPTQPDWVLSNLYTQPGFTTPLKDAKNGTAYRKLFLHFLDARMDDNTINQCVWILSQHKIKEGADVLARALKEGKVTQLHTKAAAICCIGTLGTRDHVPTIESFLRDDTQLQPFFIRGGQRGSVQVRDVALAMCVHLSGKNPKDYGYSMWNVYPNQLIQYHQLGFGSDEERSKAFQKWQSEPKKP